MTEPIEIHPFSVKAFRELGVLQEINRLVLHPLGLALEVEVDEKTGDEFLGKIWDCTEDPEGVAYGDNYVSAQKAQRVAALIEARGPARRESLGYIIQPVDPFAKQLHVSIKEPVSEKIGAAGAYNEGEEA